MTAASAARRHSWIELLQISGPFLTVPLADQTWPAGLPAVDRDTRGRLRAAVAELLASEGTNRAELARLVLAEVLEWKDALQEGPELPAALTEVVAEHGVTLRPDFAFYAEPDDLPDDDANEAQGGDEDDEEAGSAPAAATDEQPWRMLGMWAPWGTHPLSRRLYGGWTTSPVERLAALLRARNVPVGLVADGRWWALVWAPRGKPVGAAVWDASLWSEEPESLAAFVALLERRRFLGVPPQERLRALLTRSADAQEEVTTALGAQVRTAVEMLVRRFDTLNRAADGRLLADVSDDDLYAGIVTVMMRIVFLLFAEERRLLPSDDARYDAGYSVGRLVDQLRQRGSLYGEQTLEHRTGAWHRLLAVARALHAGVHHEDLRLPAYGGGMFDPDRFPWLEGRNGPPPPVDDLTVLRMLEAVQYIQLRGERRRLSFRTLDVEQIGYVYEGLLELEVRTAEEPILFLRPQRDGIDLVTASAAVEITVDLPTWTASAYLGKRRPTAATRARAQRLLATEPPPTVAINLSSALERDLAERLVDMAPLLRVDERGLPVITPAGGRYVAPSTRRASTGAHYTPRSLAEEVVQHTLEPLVYRPGPLETLDREKWILRPSSEIIALRVADIAMGSGAFLVAACRFLADRIVEAWDGEGDSEATRSLHHRTEQTADAEVNEVLLRARRLVAEHCLYGVDINPLAVEMAKLSLWLVTMDRERPFGFLDDRLVCGDSLLGVASMDQLETLHLDPIAGRQLREGSIDFGASWRGMLARAADARRRITATSVASTRDVEHKQRLLAEAHRAAAPLQIVAGALTGAGLKAAGQSARSQRAIFIELESGIWADESSRDAKILERYAAEIQAGLPAGKEPRRPLHWPLVFPEVFADTREPGFDALIGNPPFLGGKKISGALGDYYLAWLTQWDGRGVRGSADLATRFLLRSDPLLRPVGQLGYVTTKTIIEGAPLTVGLLQLEQRGWKVRRGVSPHPWPSASANLSIIEVWTSKAPVVAHAVLDDEPVPRLGVDLQPYLRETGRPVRLNENDRIAFQGSILLGLGFTLEEREADDLVRDDPRNGDVLYPYLIGADLNRRPDASASRWVINFQDWPLDRARQYSGPFERVCQLVKPMRDSTSYGSVQPWWQFLRRRPELYATIAKAEHVLAMAQTSNTLKPIRVPPRQVFDQKTIVFAANDLSLLALLCSSIHEVWAVRYTSTMRTDISYTTSDAFETLPRPAQTLELSRLGLSVDAERRDVMLARGLGLTKLYNQVHDPSVADLAIVRLRQIHEQIDYAMLDAYGWTDLDPQVGHWPTKIGTRWTVSPTTRFELLDRLLIENHRRAAVQGS